MGLKLNKTWKNIALRANRMTVVLHSRLYQDQSGQDLIEYALLAAFIAVAVAAIFPQTIAPNICQIFSKVNSSLGSANI
jgi:Flp pilus assembly pilin Flp